LDPHHRTTASPGPPSILLGKPPLRILRRECRNRNIRCFRRRRGCCCWGRTWGGT
jgi:hypothetical protein